MHALVCLLIITLLMVQANLLEAHPLDPVDDYDAPNPPVEEAAEVSSEQSVVPDEGETIRGSVNGNITEEDHPQQASPAPPSAQPRHTIPSRATSRGIVATISGVINNNRQLQKGRNTTATPKDGHGIERLSSNQASAKPAAAPKNSEGSTQNINFINDRKFIEILDSGASQSDLDALAELDKPLNEVDKKTLILNKGKILINAPGAFITTGEGQKVTDIGASNASAISELPSRTRNNSGAAVQCKNATCTTGSKTLATGMQRASTKKPLAEIITGEDQDETNDGGTGFDVNEAQGPSASPVQNGRRSTRVTPKLPVTLVNPGARSRNPADPEAFEYDNAEEANSGGQQQQGGRQQLLPASANKRSTPHPQASTGSPKAASRNGQAASMHAKSTVRRNMAQTQGPSKRPLTNPAVSPVMPEDSSPDDLPSGATDADTENERESSENNLRSLANGRRDGKQPINGTEFELQHPAHDVEYPDLLEEGAEDEPGDNLSPSTQSPKGGKQQEVATTPTKTAPAAGQQKKSTSKRPLGRQQQSPDESHAPSGNTGDENDLFSKPTNVNTTTKSKSVQKASTFKPGVKRTTRPAPIATTQNGSPEDTDALEGGEASGKTGAAEDDKQQPSDASKEKEAQEQANSGGESETTRQTTNKPKAGQTSVKIEPGKQHKNATVSPRTRAGTTHRMSDAKIINDDYEDQNLNEDNTEGAQTDLEIPETSTANKTTLLPVQHLGKLNRTHGGAGLSVKVTSKPGGNHNHTKDTSSTISTPANNEASVKNATGGSKVANATTSGRGACKPPMFCPTAENQAGNVSTTSSTSIPHHGEGDAEGPEYEEGEFEENSGSPLPGTTTAPLDAANHLSTTASSKVHATNATQQKENKGASDDVDSAPPPCTEQIPTAGTALSCQWEQFAGKQLFYWNPTNKHADASLCSVSTSIEQCKALCEKMSVCQAFHYCPNCIDFNCHILTAKAGADVTLESVMDYVDYYEKTRCSRRKSRN